MLKHYTPYGAIPIIRNAVTKPKIKAVSGKTAKIIAFPNIFGFSEIAPTDAARTSLWLKPVPIAESPIANPAPSPKRPVVEINDSNTILKNNKKYFINFKYRSQKNR